jgi:hypothetical protein
MISGNGQLEFLIIRLCAKTAFVHTMGLVSQLGTRGPKKLGAEGSTGSTLERDERRDEFGEKHYNGWHCTLRNAEITCHTRRAKFICRITTGPTCIAK